MLLEQKKDKQGIIKDKHGMVNLNFGNTLTTAIFFNIVPMIIPIKDMNYIHLWIKILFSQEIPNAPLAGRLHHFLQNWNILAQDPNIF